MFDVGGFYGSKTFVFVSLGARVVVVEPNPDCVRLLQRRFRRRDHVRLIPAIASNAEGEATVWVDDQVPEITSVQREWLSSGPAAPGIGPARPVHVRSRTLDSLIDEFGCPRYVKIDAEGHEPQVLQGLHHRCDFISFEVHRRDPDKVARCLDEISRLGEFRLNLVYENQKRFVFDHWLTRSEWQQWVWGDATPHTADLFCHVVPR
ncbi:MAG: FkbM family methyltransferase [Planctomycetia bacterium]